VEALAFISETLRSPNTNDKAFLPESAKGGPEAQSHANAGHTGAATVNRRAQSSSQREVAESRRCSDHLPQAVPDECSQGHDVVAPQSDDQNAAERNPCAESHSGVEPVSGHQDSHRHGHQGIHNR
jgi:hypothetical protein